MNTTYTIEDLYDAFTELEHRADLAQLERRVITTDPTVRPRRRRRDFRSLPVLATVAAVAAVVVGTMWVVPGDSGGSAGSTVTAPPPGSPTGPAPDSPTGTPPGSPSAPYPTEADPEGPPKTPEELAARLQVILGDERPITVRRSNVDSGVYIDGTVTVNGVTGTYALDYFSEPGSGNGSGMMSLGVIAGRKSDDGRFELRMTVGPPWNDQTDDPFPNTENPMTQAELDAVVNSDLWW